LWIVRRQVHEHADTPHPVRMLRARRKRPAYRRAAEKRDELASRDASCHVIHPA
jgi:hypothetical protein